MPCGIPNLGHLHEMLHPAEVAKEGFKKIYICFYVLTLQCCVFTVPANDQTVDSILVFNLVLSWVAQWVDWNSTFIPANS